MRNRSICHIIAQSFQAYLNCMDKGNVEWMEKHESRIETLVRDKFPSGSGFDNGTQFDWDASKPEKLVFNTAFHHMNDVGYYVGWSEHQVIVTPSLQSCCGFELRVTGRDKRDIKAYIADCFHVALSEMITEGVKE